MNYIFTVLTVLMLIEIMLVKSLFNLSLEASYHGINKLKHKLFILPKCLLYELLSRCLKEQDHQAFETLFDTWPLCKFSLSTNKENTAACTLIERMVYVSTSIRNQKCGRIRCFDLPLTQLYPMLVPYIIYYQVCIKITNDILTAMMRCNAKPFWKKRKTPSNCHKIENHYFSIKMDVYIHDCNYSKYIKVMKLSNRCTQLLPRRVILYLTSKCLIKFLKMNDKTETDMMINLNGLSKLSLKKVLNQLKQFPLLESLSVLQQKMDQDSVLILKGIISRLTNLRYLQLDMKNNKILDTLLESISSHKLHTLILDGCGIDGKCFVTLLDNQEIFNLNALILRGCQCKLHLKSLKDLLFKFKHSLKLLDLSYCDLDKSDILNMLPFFKTMTALDMLKIYGNSGVESEIELEMMQTYFEDVCVMTWP